MKRKGSSLLALGLTASMLVGTVVPTYGLNDTAAQSTVTNNQHAVTVHDSRC